MNTEFVGAETSLSAERTYRNLRVVMVGTLVALTAAVLQQTAEQHLLLGSISAYYYTPVQSIFVGTLIGLGLAMIALRGTNDVEDVLLNIAGIAAPVIALVPTSRGSDFRDARQACEAAGVTGPSPQAGPGGPLDCPTIRAIVAANRENVQNNMFAYLFAGALALAFAWYLVIREARAARQHRGLPLTKRTVWSVGAATAFWLVTSVVYVWGLDWLIDNGHFWAATGLFVLIVGVVVANAFRLSEVSGTSPKGGRRVGSDIKSTLTGPGRFYGYYAILMVVITAIAIVLWMFGPLTFFWVEFTVIVLFAVFWIVQTREQYLTTMSGMAAALKTPTQPREDPVK